MRLRPQDRVWRTHQPGWHRRTDHRACSECQGHCLRGIWTAHRTPTIWRPFSLWREPSTVIQRRKGPRAPVKGWEEPI